MEKTIEVDPITLIVVIIIAGAFIVLIYSYNLEVVNKCTTNPFQYGIDELKDHSTADMFLGTITMISKKGGTKTIHFGDQTEKYYYKYALNLTLNKS